MKLDIERLTLGEVAKLEELSGQGLASIADDNAPKGKLLAALIFVASRRFGEPKTWNDCLSYTPDEANDYLGLDDDDAQDDAQDDAGELEDAGEPVDPTPAGS